MTLLASSPTQAKLSAHPQDRHSQTTLELAIVDPSLDRWQQLVAGVRPECQPVILNPNDDGIEQITQILKSHRQIGHSIRALHIISHGSPGCLDLGSSQLKLHNLDRYTNQLKQWRSAFTDNPDILIYGCEFAANGSLALFQQRTGANIAASRTLTGNPLQGGNWQLEVCLGEISTPLAFTAATLRAYPSVLALNFSTQSLFNVGNDPLSVAVGDLNNDGNLDFVTADQNDGTISLLFGDGTGNFTPQTPIPGFLNPMFLTIADFNNDTNLDIAVANSAGQNVRVLLGDGNGNFPTDNAIALGGGSLSPFSLAVGNLNGDANLDLVTTNVASGNISVLLGDGTGDFPTENAIAVGNDPQFVAVGSFDADANQDLVVATDISFNGSMLLGDGSGNFPSQNTFGGGGTNPRSVTVGDFNNDGNPDAAIANDGSNDISIFTGNGAGVFTFTNSFPTGNNPKFLISQDLDGDGELDLAVGNETDNNISILLGDGAGNFGAAINFAVGTDPRSLAVGDFNGDSKPDLAVANRTSNNVSILLNTTPKVAITPGTAPAETGSTSGNFTITLDEPAPTGGLTVNFNLTGSTATDPDDYTLTAGTNITNLTANTFTIAPGEISATIDVVPVDDTIDDSGESVQLNLDLGINYFVDTTNNTANLAIVDNETSGVIIIPTSGLTTTEAGTAATFRVKLQTQPTADVNINLNSDNPNEGTIDLSAITLNATNWNTFQTITVTGVDDAIEDGDISYSIVTSTTTTDANYSAIDPDDIALTNTDNDIAGVTITPIAGLTTTEAGGTATFDMVLNSEPTADVTINLTSSDSNEGTVSQSAIIFNATNWNTAQTVTVTGVDDAIEDGDISYSIVTSTTTTDANYSAIDPNDIALTNTDNDIAGVTITPIAGLTTTEAGGTATFDIQLNSEPTADVNINLSSDNPNEGNVSQSAIIFNANNWNTAQTVTVTGVDDAIEDGDINYSIVTSTTTTDTNYSAIDPDDIALTNTDNDIAGVTINPIAGLTTTEAGGTATFDIQLNSEPTADVNINLSSDNPNEGNVSQSAIIFNATNWNTAQNVTVTGVDDAIEDGDISYSIVTSTTTTDANYSAIDPDDIALTNTDNDIAGVTITPIAGLTTTETGGTATFDIQLNSEPTADVTINLTSSDSNEGTVSQSAIIFNATNWNTAQTVTVTGVDDAIRDGDISYSILTSLVSTDINYAAIDPNDIEIANADDDTADVLIDPINLNVTEGVSGILNIRLNSQPTAPVTIAFNSGNQLNPISSVTFTPDNWNQIQTVKIKPADDALEEPLQTETIAVNVISTDANYNNLAIAPISVNIIDNDAPGLSIFQPVGNTWVLEGFGEDIYKIKLNTPPIADVEVAISTDEQITSDRPTLTFTPVNWNVAQTVRVTAVDDGDIEGDLQSNISHQLTSADPEYHQLAIADLTVEVSDRQSLNNLFDLSAESPISGVSKISISGSELDDRIIGSNFADILYAREGNDLLFGGNGDDILSGQFGDNGISGGEGEDIIIGSMNDDYLSGDNGDDQVFGSNGGDRIHGGNGNDSLFGENGNDHLFGEAGADLLIGHGGIDAFAIGNGTGGMTIETADIIQDFTLTEDAIDLIQSLTFADLTIVQGSGLYANDAIIQVTATQEYLARLSAIDASSLTQEFFI